ncbi:hypothetical protein [Roseiconus lacunae]|uniref:Uncharacterized protein n=1 Tax=Roseiconus lacunae TaxID=2605694 RepID=A0ABT7PKA6_9BACT|nr:hypothetical protein [Roseiconus lacunae]MCD0461030.1 hypothetical protein [Roseiconus lacunae]MDM4016933.1 hypothetical protein [Roseiconus lacunae]
MRFFVMIQAVFAAIALVDFSPVDAQEKTGPVIVALDQATADLWCSYFPEADLRVVVPNDDLDYAVVNVRALSVCDASYLLYRRDQNSLVTQLFRERIANQGVFSVDLVEFFRRHDLSPRDRSRSGECNFAAVIDAMKFLPSRPSIVEFSATSDSEHARNVSLTAGKQMR